MLVVSTWYPSKESPGMGSFVHDDVSLLMRDHDVTVLHLAPSQQISEPRRDVDGRLTIYRFPMDVSRPLSIARAARLAARMLRHADVLHSMALSAILPLALVRVRVPWVHTEHWSGLLAPQTVPLFMRATLPLTSRLLAKPDVVVAVSNMLRQRITEVRPGRIEVIPNHVEHAEPASPERDLSDGAQLVSIGSAIPRKGPVLAVQTVAELRARGIAVRLTWLGNGPQLPEAIAEAEQLGLSDATDFPGNVTRDEVLRHLGRAHAFVLPTESETFGVAIAESLASGVPVVVGGEGAHREFVDEPDGILVSDRTPQAFADAIERVLQLNLDRDRTQIGSAARRLFSDDTRRDRYQSVYEHARGVPDTSTPTVDVIIPVHTTTRPIARAVSSALKNAVALRVTVVCHNIEATLIAAELGELCDDPRVRLIEHADGVASPTGPFNAGLDLADAQYTSVMGSDDELEPGAIDSWVNRAEASGAEAVLPRMRHARGGAIPTPPVRPWRSHRLDLVKDRLAYRSAPLGLVARARFGHLRFDASVATGEDVPYVTNLWSAARRIEFDRSGPAYLVHDDAADRTSFTQRPIRGDLEFIEMLIRSSSFTQMSVAQRTAVLTKVLRVNVIGAIAKRKEWAWTTEDREYLAQTVRSVRAAAPRAANPLPIVDSSLLDLSADPAAPIEKILALAASHYKRASPRSVISRSVMGTFHRESVLRMGAATAFLMLSAKLRRKS